MPTLAGLPLGVVEVIMELVFETHPRQYLGGISQQTVVVSRRVTFAEVKLDSAKRVRKFRRLIKLSPEVPLAPYSLEISGTEAVDQAWRWFSSKSPRSSPPSSPPPVPCAFPHLCVLKLSGDSFNFEPIHPSLFDFIAAHPRLFEVHLSSFLFLMPHTQHNLPATRITHLHLLKLSSRRRTHASGENPLSFFPALRHLTLHDTERPLTVSGSILESLPSPHLLQELDLYLTHRPRPSFFYAFSKLNNLRRLTLCQAGDPQSEEKDNDWGVINALHSLPLLAHLTFSPSPSAFPSFSALRFLLSEPLHCPSLLSITLADVYPERHRPQPQVPSSTSSPSARPPLGRRRSTWTYDVEAAESWERERAECRVRLVELTEKRGVNLRGGLVEWARRKRHGQEQSASL